MGSLPSVNALSQPHLTMSQGGNEVVTGVFQDIFSVYLAVLVVFWLISCLRPERQKPPKRKSKNKKEGEEEIGKEKESADNKDEDKKKESEGEEKPSTTDSNASLEEKEIKTGVPVEVEDKKNI